MKAGLLLGVTIPCYLRYNGVMNIRENVPISTLTTMRLGGAARYVLEIEDKNDIIEAFDFIDASRLPFWIMGGGANTIGKDAGFSGAIILNCLSGIEVAAEVNGLLQVRAMGGVKWDDLVKFCCEKGYSGIEALSKIPGTVGAAPVQNIGAYGQDVGQTLVGVEAFDTVTRTFVQIPKSEMKLGYRKSRFNSGEDVGRFLITSVQISLSKNYLVPPFYNSLQKYIDMNGVTDFSPMNIRRMVSEIRAEKLPDPELVPSSGSFFKNVFLDSGGADHAEQKGIPVWRNADGSGKINSGWLIEQCGLKGKELDGFQVSDKAALVLINRNAKSYADLAKARKTIVDAVKERFGYSLEQEPVEIPTGE